MLNPGIWDWSRGNAEKKRKFEEIERAREKERERQEEIRGGIIKTREGYIFAAGMQEQSFAS